MEAWLDKLLKPRAVAVIGASDDPARIGGRPVRYMREGGFTGRVVAVNPGRATVQGLPAARSIAAVGGPIDLAVVAVPAARVRETIAECAAAGVGAAVVFSAGFAELGEAGRAEQREIARIARVAGMRVVGPTCLGGYNSARGLFATFTSTLEHGYPKPGPLALVSQSGAYASHLSLIATLRGIPVRYLVSTGNECDVQIADCIEALAADDDVGVIAAYAEGVRDGRALLRALEAARAAGKRVIFMKVGRSEVGAHAARSHTDALAGSDAVYDAVLSQLGVYRAHSTEELLDVAYGCSAGRYPASRRLGLMTISGGVGIQMADEADALGLDLAPMPDRAQEQMRAALPYVSARNPVDVTAQVVNDPGLVALGLQLMLDLGRYDAIVAFFTSIASAENLVEPIRAALRESRRRHPDALLVLSLVGSREVVAAYEADGCLVFEDPLRAVRTVAALAGLARPRARIAAPPEAWPEVAPLPPGRPGEAAARRLLEAAGIAFAPWALVTSAAEAIGAGRPGSPMALKISSPDIAHKTEVGGVELGVAPGAALGQAFDALVARVREACPGARLDGVIASPMVGGGVEVILGARHDETFGPVVMLGLGGVLVEVLDDVVTRLAPVDETEARRMIEALRGRALLEGVRGRMPCDLAALATMVAALSRFACAHAETLQSVELNPVAVLPRGQGALALDALVVPRRSTE
jgi:acyl-CoA synthetase (NDP forming)